jgi:hypothetical protein
MKHTGQANRAGRFSEEKRQVHRQVFISTSRSVLVLRAYETIASDYLADTGKIGVCIRVTDNTNEGEKDRWLGSGILEHLSLIGR